jgi:hypothetical protein
MIYITNNTREKVPSIEITPSMRQSLTKEGQSIYGTSQV